jgi:hypothetical protein
LDCAVPVAPVFFNINVVAVPSPIVSEYSLAVILPSTPEVKLTEAKPVV